MSESKNTDQLQDRYYDDEIDLKELVMKLWQRKLWILVSTLILAISSFFYGQYVTPVFKSSLTLSVPPTLNFVSFQDSKIKKISPKGFMERVLTHIKNEEILDSVALSLGQNLKVQKIVVPRKIPALPTAVNISMEHQSPIFAASYLNEVVNTAHDLAREEIIAELNANRDAEITRLSLIISSIEEDPVLVAGIKKEELLLPFAQKLYIQKSLKPEHIVTDLVIVTAAAEAAHSPIKPKKSLILALGTILGLMLGSFLALVIPQRD